jgi:hypothetical protein
MAFNLDRYHWNIGIFYCKGLFPLIIPKKWLRYDLNIFSEEM